MDRHVDVKINGTHLSKGNNRAGVQGEANVTYLRIEFDNGWDGYAKHVTFWNAKGKNPVTIPLTADMLEDITNSTRIYLCPVPGEALTEGGLCTFIVDGYTNGKRQRSVSDELEVIPAPQTEGSADAQDPTPTEAERLQVQIDGILETIANEVTGASVHAANAASSELAARASEDSASSYAAQALSYADTAKNHADTAKGHEDTAASYATVASERADAASSSAEHASASELNAYSYADQANSSAGDAAISAQQAAASAQNAGETVRQAAADALQACESAAQGASESAAQAAASAELAQSHAQSAGDSVVQAATSEGNAAEYAKQASESAGDALASENAAAGHAAEAKVAAQEAKDAASSTMMPALELIPLQGDIIGGYIDFHYAGEMNDFTSRIIESGRGIIDVIGTLRENGVRVYSPSNKPSAGDVNAFPDGILSQADLNAAPQGSYACQDCLNGPAGNTVGLLICKVYDGNYMWQLYHSYAHKKTFQRYCDGAVWAPWEEIYTSRNLAELRDALKAIW